MSNIIKKHFPNSKIQWKSYIFISVPVILGSLLYALNGFIDNFMVGSKRGGAAALSAANVWSGIIFAIIASICATGAIFIAQYYNKNDFENARKMQRVRTLICLFFAITLALFAFITPGLLIRFSIGNNSNNSEYHYIFNGGKKYIRIIAITWIFVAISMPAALSLSETGHGKYYLFVALTGLLINIVGNYLFIYEWGFGVEGTAYATLISRIITFCAYQIIMIFLKFKLWLNPFKLFNINTNILKQFLKRSFLLIFSSCTFILIELRVPLFARAYPIGSIGNSAGAISVFALTYAIMNIFMSTFAAISANAANFISKELGKGNIKQAKINSNQLKGFNTLISIILSLILFAISFAIPSFNFLVQNEKSGEEILENVKYTIWTICFIYPAWAWLESSRINSLSGGKVNIQTAIDFIYGICQLLLLIVMVYVIIHNSSIKLPMAFFYFSLSDFILLIAFEIAYYKIDWCKNVTKEFAQAEIDISKDIYKNQVSYE